jgi:O-antigen ligase
LIAPARPEVAAQGTGASGPVLFWTAASILVFAPLVWGGNRPVPLLVLECAGLVALLALAWSPAGAGTWTRLPATLRWGIALLVVTPLVQLVPLPASWWLALPGHGAYAGVLDVAGAGEGWRSYSMNPRATEYAWLALIPCLAVFLVVQGLSRREVRKLTLVFLCVAIAEAVLGILQVGAGKDSLLRLGNPFSVSAATGTYINKNHFAALMAMALPVALAFWAMETLPPVDQHGERLREHPRHADAKLARRILWSLLIVLMLAALLFTRSRAGIGCGFAALGAASLGLVWNAGTMRLRIALVSMAGLALLLAAYVGLTPIVERFAPEELALSYEGRLRIAAAAMRGGLDFLPLGSGLGTFADVFRRYQTEGLTGFIDHAHNDYAEAFLELGVVGLAVMALFAAAYLMRWGAITAKRLSRTLGYLQVAAGLAVLAMAAHGFFDFNFHIPANAIFCSFLAGVFFHRAEA